PGNLATGNYYVLVVANDDGGQPESDPTNRANNVFAAPISLSAPDLQATGVSGPASSYVGTLVLVSWTDQNNGTGTASGTWTDNVYVATDAQGNNRTLLGSFPVTSALAVGASLQRVQQVTLPLTAGTYWFTVVTNATGSLAEGTNFNNNTAVA